jgi:2-C-methyl-D-erythritol 4-phosphate cytidylyltransferase
MITVALIPTAGTGERLGASVPKPLIEINGEPLIAHTLKVFERVASVAGVVLVVHPYYKKDYQDLVDSYGFKKISAIVDGGATRSQSVRNGLRALPPDADFVIVHDGVRPIVTVDLIERGLALAREEKAVIAAVPVKPTLKVVDPQTNIVRETLDRTLVWEIQTPQIFERKLLERAYAGDTEATDDAALVERLGVPVKVFMGDYRNIKITTPDDLIVAEALLRGKL